MKMLQPIEGEVSLAEVDHAGYFYFTADNALESLGPNIRKGLDPQTFARGTAERQKLLAASLQGEHPMSIVAKILEAWWRAGGQPDLYDVGAHVGRFSTPLAVLGKQRQKTMKTFVFEPGRTADLVPFNLRMNGVDDVAEHAPLIVSDHNGSDLLRFNPTYLVSGRAYTPGADYITRLCQSTTLDAFRAAKSLRGDAFVKIDTEGLELSVLGGAIDLITEGKYVIVLEYRDWLYKPGVEMWKRLMNEAYVFDVGEAMSIPFIHEVTDLDGQVERLALPKLGNGHSDVFFISKRLPCAEALRNVLVAHA